MHEKKETKIVQLIFEKSSWIKTYIHVIKLEKYKKSVDKRKTKWMGKGKKERPN